MPGTRSSIRTLITAIAASLLLSTFGCGGRTVYQVAAERAERQHRADHDPTALHQWEQDIPVERRDQTRARMLAHHVYVLARQDALLLDAQISHPELIDGEPELSYPREFRSREPVLVVMACIVEINGLVSNCTTVEGPPGLAGYVRRTVIQWTYLPSIGRDGQPHAASFLFVLPFRPY